MLKIDHIFFKYPPSLVILLHWIWKLHIYWSYLPVPNQFLPNWDMDFNSCLLISFDNLETSLEGV